MAKILVVDDDAEILEALELVLEEAGHRTITTADGTQTVSLAQQHQPDVIVLDMLLSGHDGREFCRVLKSSADTKHIPVIVTSAHAHGRTTALAAGADEFIAKPFDVLEFIRTIDDYAT